MSADIDGGGLLNEIEELIDGCHVEAAEEFVIGGERADEDRVHAKLPWIGALPNPRLGPMVVINDGGYFVPLFTAVDLVRGCRYFWRRTLE
ncbi:MAG TPA: hypothetical protein VK200_15020 [Candidatus Limnocylindrales bacterium]|nr:hypothetical protein [Candidatus Limnocylindrales bacterium]